MPNRLAARQIQVRYSAAALPALTEFSLSVAAGQFLGVVGPNGSGKSTLIRALSRALRPAAGAVLLEEANLYADVTARASAQGIGVVPQETAISLDFTVREVVRMGRAPHLPRRPFAAETAQDEQIVSEALESVGMRAFAERAVSTLSGGERQRVLFARALAQETDILLLDEPTAHLDLRHQTETLSLARDLAHTQGKAVLAVLHDLNLAGAYCDQLVLLHEGHIVAQGSPEEVLTPHNLQQVYGARVWIRPHPASGRPLVLTLPELPDKNEPEGGGRPIHVLCGGGTGAGLLLALRRQGYEVTAGGLNDGDTDAEAATMLDIPYARESSFSPLTPHVLAEAARLAAPADFVLLTEVPFGSANLANLQSALALRRAGKAVLCLHSPGSDFSARDFTGGEAARLWEQLLAEGAILIPSIAVALSLLERIIHGSTD